MKNAATFGFAMMLSQAVLTMIPFVLGMHSDPAKMAGAQAIGYFSIPIILVILVFGVRAARNNQPTGEGFSYGKAFGAGALIGLFGGFFGGVFHLIYSTVINPDFRETIVKSELAKLEAKGVAVNDQMESMMRMFTNPALMATMTFISVTLTLVLASLIVAAFLKRPAEPQTAPGA